MKEPWTGTASDLLSRLEELTATADGKPDQLRRRRDWPKSPNALSGQLRRLAPALRSSGIVVEFAREAGGTRRLITIRDERKEKAETSSQRHRSSHASGTGCDDPCDDPPTAGDAEIVTPTTEPVARAAGIAVCDDLVGACDDGKSKDRHTSHQRDVTVCDAVTISSPLFYTHTYITEPTALAQAMATVATSTVLGLDTETTGLDPHTDRLRLLTLSTADHTYIVDIWACTGWQDLVRPLLTDPSRTVIAHNAGFHLRFLLAAGIAVDATVHDSLIMAQLIDGGVSYDEADGTTGKRRSYALATVVERALGVHLDKEQQVSDWSRPTLTTEQLTYAARDAAILLPLYAHQRAVLAATGLERVAAIEAACTPALTWLEHSGMPFDAEAWRVLSDAAVADEQRLRREIMAVFTKAGANQFGGFRLKLESLQQLRLALGKVGIDIPDTNEATLLAVKDQHAVVPLLLAWRDASKRASVYGIEFIAKHVHATTGRVHADYRQLGSAAGRMACTKPNMQNIPRTKEYRACFRPQPGHVLVKVDYTAIELRLAAAIANDATMLAAFREGADLHKRTAAIVLGVPEEQVTKEARQLAKALNFGLLYGMGATTLLEHARTNYGVQLAPEEAAHHRDRFFATYKGLAAWHRQTGHDAATETRTLTGRRRLNVGTFMQRLNSPVQGSGADGLKAAVGRLWRYRHDAPTARLVAVVHDEIVAECPATDAPAVADWLKSHMIAGMEEVTKGAVPIEVETQIARDWSGTPLDAA